MSETHLSAGFFDAVPICLFRMTPDGRFLEANPALVRLLGYPSREALLAASPAELWLDLEECRRALQAVTGAHELEVRVRRYDRSTRLLRLSLVAAHGLDPGHAVFEGAIEDVTQRSNEARSESERALRLILRSAPGLFWAIDREGVLQLVEGKALEAIGWQPGQAVGRSIFEEFTEYPHLNANFRRVLGGEDFDDTVEYRGALFDVRYSTVHDAEGRLAGAIGFGFDVTAEHRSAVEARRFAAIIENTSDFVGVASPTGEVLYVNPAGLKLVGLERVRTGMTVLDFFHKEDGPRIMEVVQRQFQSEVGLEYEAAFPSLSDGSQDPLPVEDVHHSRPRDRHDSRGGDDHA